MTFRVGDPVLVRVARPPHVQSKRPRAATVQGQGRDSGGPWVLVEYENGTRELVHPDRVEKT